MDNPFLDEVHTGRNEWWRYPLAGLVMLLVLWVTSPILMALAVVANHGHPLPALDSAAYPRAGVDLLVSYYAAMAPAVAYLASLYVAVELVHRRSLRSLVTPQQAVNWRRMAQGFALWMAIHGLWSVVSYAAAPTELDLTPDPARFLALLVVAPLLTPLDAAVQELFFRGYLMQAASLLSKRLLPVVALPSLLFALAHSRNPEVSAGRLMLLYYLAVGVFYAIVSLRDGSLELAIGAHAATNLFIALFANYDGSALPTPAVFTFSKPQALPSLAIFAVKAAVFCLCFFGPRPLPRLTRRR